MNTRSVLQSALIAFGIAWLSACANYEVVKSTGNVKAPIPPNSLTLVWIRQSPSVGVGKQERGMLANPRVSEQEMSMYGPVAKQSAKAIMTHLHGFLNAGLKAYVAINTDHPNGKYLLRTELKKVFIDTAGPRRATLLAEVIAPDQATPIWQVQLDVDVSASTSDEIFVKRCAGAIWNEMKASKLIN